MSFRILLVFLLSSNPGTVFLGRTLGVLHARTAGFCPLKRDCPGALSWGEDLQCGL